MEKIELIHTDVLRCCGRLALESGLFPQAFELLTGALDREPTDANTLLLLSKAYMQSSDAASVIRMIVNAINAGVSTIASDSRIWTVLAMSYDQLDWFADSLHAVTQALLLESYYSVDPDLHVMQCRFFLRQGVHQYPLEALLPYFDKMLESVKVGGAAANVHVEALITRAQLLYKYADFERALVDLELAMKLLNDKNESFSTGERLAKISYTYLLASVLQFLANRPADSLKLVEDAIVCFSHTAKSVQPLILASGMMSSLMEKDLYATLDRMILEEPHSAPGTAFQMNYIIARLLLQLDPVRNVYEAYGYYRKALNLDIGKPYIWISIGSLYLRLGQVNDALSAYTQGSVLALESASSTANTAGTAGASSGAASASTSSGGSQPSFMENFNNLFAALAWFGIAQTYIFSRDFPSAVEALSRSAQFFAKANNPHQADELQRQAHNLSAHLVRPVSALNIEYTIPDVPFQLLLDLLLYEDQDAFSVKGRIERNQESSIMRATASGAQRPSITAFNQPTNTTLIKLENSDAKKVAKSLSGTRSSGESNRVEKRKSNNNSRKNSISAFKRAGLPANHSPPFINGSSSLSNGNPLTGAPNPGPAPVLTPLTRRPSAQAQAPASQQVTTTKAAAVPSTQATLPPHEVNKSTTNSPILVPTQQRLTPLLPNNNFAHQYSDYSRPENATQINPINSYYHPQLMPNIGSSHAALQPSQGTVPLVYQNYRSFAAPPRQMSTYVYYP